MPRVSKILFLLLATLVTIGLVGTSLNVAAQDKKDKKDAKKEDKKDVKKEEKKEEKKEPFKPDPAQHELKYLEKDKSFWVNAVAFGADGKSVAADYRPHTVVIWDLITKKESKTIKGPELRGLGEFKSLVYANDQVFVGTGKLIKKEKEKVKDKVPEKEKAVEKAKDKTPEKDKAIEKGKDKTPVKDVPFREGEIKVWDAKSGKPGISLMGHNDNVEALALSKDGKFLASGSKDTTVKIWDLAAGKETQTLKGHTDDVISVGFSPDGKQVVTTSMDKTVRVWNIADAKEVASFKVENMVKTKDPKGKETQVKEIGREFTHALFTNDGKKVIACNRDGLIKFYDIDAKKEDRELKAHEGVLALALSPDGSKLATGGYDHLIKIWDTTNGKELRTIKAHLGNVLTLTFSADNQWLASGSIDGTVKIWSVK